jgi:hypothetical protein
MSNNDMQVTQHGLMWGKLSAQLVYIAVQRGHGYLLPSEPFKYALHGFIVRELALSPEIK